MQDAKRHRENVKCQYLNAKAPNDARKMTRQIVEIKISTKPGNLINRPVGPINSAHTYMREVFFFL